MKMTWLTGGLYYETVSTNAGVNLNDLVLQNLTKEIWLSSTSTNLLSQSRFSDSRYVRIHVKHESVASVDQSIIHLYTDQP